MRKIKTREKEFFFFVFLTLHYINRQQLKTLKPVRNTSTICIKHKQNLKLFRAKKFIFISINKNKCVVVFWCNASTTQTTKFYFMRNVYFYVFEDA